MCVCRPLKTHFKWAHIKLMIICVLLVLACLVFHRKTSAVDEKSPTESSKLNQTKLNAFILTDDCASHKYNKTKTNIEVAFPNLFSFSCVPPVPFTDPRIHILPLHQPKLDSSNVLTFIDLWTYKIAENLKTDEYQWSFIFEDDISFVDASFISLPNYNTPLQELMTNREVQEKHGFFYLGLCRATFDNDNYSLTFNRTGHQLHSRKGCGFCRHATAITTKRAELLWSEISSYRSDVDGTIDILLHNYCVRSGNHFYTFGANFQNSSNGEQIGIAYNNRA